MTESKAQAQVKPAGVADNTQPAESQTPKRTTSTPVRARQTSTRKRPVPKIRPEDVALVPVFIETPDYDALVAEFGDPA